MKTHVGVLSTGLVAATMAVVFVVGTDAARGGTCTEISTVWNLMSRYADGSTGTRIYGDGLGAYTDGVSGVTARIRSCSTNDAVLMAGNRNVLFNFAGAFLGQGNVAAPAWTKGAAFASTPSTHKGGCGGSPCTVLNIRNILADGTAPRDQYYVLYTRFGSSFVAPDNGSYRLWMHNPNAGTPEDTDGLVNSPYWNARAVVEHFPATTSTKEYWLAYPEAPNAFSPSSENGTLVSNDYPVSTNYGQFSMPFYFRIEVK